MDNDILTAERLRAVVDYNPETGIFTRKVRLAQRHQVGDRADFSINKGKLTGYRRLSLDSKRYLAHRCAWLYVHGEWPRHDIDHINGERSDNRISNLRDVVAQTNMENQRRARKDNKSGLLGVYFSNGQWYASLQSKGKNVFRKSFKCPMEAHKAYLKAKEKYHKGCTI